MSLKQAKFNFQSFYTKNNHKIFIIFTKIELIMMTTYSKLSIVTLFLSVFTFAQQGGGMWIPTELNEQEMKEMGMNISAKDILSKAETEYLGVVSGRLIKQSFNLNGNIIIKEAVLK